MNCFTANIECYIDIGSVNNVEGDDGVTGTADGHYNNLQQQPEGVCETPTESAAREVGSKLELESVTNLATSKLKSMEILKVETSAEVKHSQLDESFVINKTSWNT